MICAACRENVPDLKFCDQCGRRAPAPAQPGTSSAEPSPLPANPPEPEPQDAEDLRKALEFFRTGDYDAAAQVLKELPDLKPPHRSLLEFIQPLFLNRPKDPLLMESSRQSERVLIAAKLRELSMMPEALGVLTQNAVLSAPGRDETSTVAEFFAESDQLPLFLNDIAPQLDSRAASAYAAAFMMLDQNDAALRLLELKKELDGNDYKLFFALHRRLGTLEKIKTASLPVDQRADLAHALIGEGKENLALKVLEEIPRSDWTKGDFAAGLRLLQLIDHFDEAKKLFKQIQASLSLREASELHYYFALFSEKHGDVAFAKTIYANLRELLGPYKDIDRRLKNLQALSAADISRMSTGLTTPRPTPPTKAGESPPPLVPPAVGDGAGELIAGRFEFTRPLGSGGMGFVFQARDTRLDRMVALKKVHDHLSSDPEAKASLLQEAKTLSSISSPYIVPLYDIVESEGQTYLVFEFVEGETISELLASAGAIQPRWCRRVLQYVCRALMETHAEGILHLDLKPANIMRHRRGHVLVMDFGIAKHVSRETDQAGGSPAYMAPEQHEGRVVLQSDFFALGVTAYEMLTNEVPFAQEDLHAEKMMERYEPLPESVPTTLRRLIENCLRADPAQRPQDARAILAALAASSSMPG